MNEPLTGTLRTWQKRYLEDCSYLKFCDSQGLWGVVAIRVLEKRSQQPLQDRFPMVSLYWMVYPLVNVYVTMVQIIICNLWIDMDRPTLSMGHLTNVRVIARGYRLKRTTLVEPMAHPTR